MLKFKNLSIKNFMSVGQNTQFLDLNGVGLTLVLGENLDLGGDGNRNGSGKTGLVNALSFALYGYPISNIKKDNLVNAINKRNMAVSIEFENNGKKYKIERGRKPAFLRYFIEDGIINSPENDESQGESKWTQNEIEKAIGLNYVLFKHIVALTTDTEAFLRMKAADQRTIIEELLGITLLSQKSENLKEAIKNSKEGIKEEEFKIKSINEANIRLQKSIDDGLIKLHLWDKQHTEKINQLIRDKSILEDIDFDFEIEQFNLLDDWEASQKNITQTISTLEKERRTFDTQLNALEKDAKYFRSLLENKSDQKYRLLQDISRKEKEIEHIGEEKKSIDKKFAELEEKLMNPDSFVCHTCNQPLKDDEHKQEVIKNLTTEYEFTETKNKRLETNLIHIMNQIEEINKDIIEFDSNQEKLQKEHLANAEKKEEESIGIQVQLTELNETIVIKNQEISNLGTKPKSKFKSRDDAYQTKARYEQLFRDLEEESTRINPHIDHVESLKKNLQILDYSIMNELTHLKEHQDVLLKLLTSKDSFIRKKIIDQNLSFLNHRLKYYLNKLNLPHEVRFINDLSVEIQKLGQDFDFDNLSNGEQLRVVIALSFSFADIWESMNTSINLLFIDEVIDAGMDSAGVEAVLELLKKNARERKKNIFLISHREELISRVSNVLMVRKEGGFTTIDYDSESGSERI